MISPVTSAEKRAAPDCAPMAANSSPVPTTSMATPLSSEASGNRSLPNWNPRMVRGDHHAAPLQDWGRR